jgi:hypothetical protein
MKGSLRVHRVRVRSFFLMFLVPTWCSATCGCVVIGCFGICDCRSLRDGSMIVAMFHCHVRSYMRFCHVMLHNACEDLLQQSLLISGVKHPIVTASSSQSAEIMHSLALMDLFRWYSGIWTMGSILNII